MERMVFMTSQNNPIRIWEENVLHELHNWEIIRVKNKGDFREYTYTYYRSECIT